MKPKKKFNKKHTSSTPRRGDKRDKGRGGLSDMAVLIISRITEDGELLAVPQEWNPRKELPYILITSNGRMQAPAVGERVLAKMRQVKAHTYEAHIIRILPEEKALTAVGIFVSTTGGGGIIEPVSRKSKDSYRVSPEEVNGASQGELVRASTLPGAQHFGMVQARIEERLGDARAPRAASLIAAQLHQLPSVFSKEALAEAEAAPLPLLTPDREDLRGLPLVTIDGEDARDFDDAVFAEPDPVGGFHLVIAIADVAHYVAEHCALDIDAFERGNSVYFPDRVIPMLPERLSNGLCSLKPNEDRYCIAVHLWIDAQGHAKRYRFTRGLMRSQARLTYTQVEEAGAGSDDPIIANLYAAYKALSIERDQRHTLEINLPEYKVYFGANGQVEQIAPKPSLESHRLIEAFMVAANVAAANNLLKARAPGMYRVHEAPSEEKLDDLRKFLGLSGYSLPKGVITPVQLNKVLRKAKDRPDETMIHTMILRSQMQAYYDSKNLGHFGLGLEQYCHFTSPIRRYADLIVHRSLTAMLTKNDDTFPPRDSLDKIALHISQTERTAMLAERDAMDRYKIAYLTCQNEAVFSGSINSLNDHGLFVSLTGNGITGFIPVSQLGDDFFLYHPRKSCFIGRQTNITYALGDAIAVRVVEADPLKGTLIFRPDKNGMRPPLRKGKGKGHRGKPKPESK